MNGERAIEKAIMKSPQALEYPGALAIRNVRLDTNKRSGRLDVLLLPPTGPHKLALVECKVSTARDADGKCIGQLLKYFTFALSIGSDGVERLTEYANSCPDAARGVKPTTPKKILGLANEADGVSALHEGTPISPQQIGLYVAIDGQAHGALPKITSSLAEHFGLHIGIVVVEGGLVRLDTAEAS